MVNNQSDLEYKRRKFILLTIKNRSDFLRLKESGKRKKLSSWLLVNFKTNDVNKMRFGFTLSKKVGSSVLRNRLRRLFKESIREYFKSNEELNLDVNFVFLVHEKNQTLNKINQSQVKEIVFSFFRSF